MKYLLFIILLVAVVITAGCVSENKNMVFTPIQTTGISSEPIVGIWQWAAVDGSKLYTFTFFSDGRYSFTDSSDPNTLSGTWSKVRENEYIIAYTSGKNQALLYHSATDTFTMPEFSVLVYRLGKGPVRTYIQTESDRIISIETGPLTTLDPRQTRFALLQYPNGTYYISGTPVPTPSLSNIQVVGNVYGLSSVPSSGIDEIKFTIGLAPGAPSIDLTKMTIVFLTPTTGSTIITHEHTTSVTSSSTFTTKIGTTDVTSMNANDQFEVAFLVAPVPANTKIKIELRPNVGAALPFSKTVPATIAATNVLN